MTPEQEKFFDIKNTTDYKKAGDDVDYKVFVDHDKQEVVLQFRESDSRTDWIHNFQFLPWPLRLDNKIVWTTRGYALAYKSTKDIPMNEFIDAILYKGMPEYAICIRGWSFGSAMAKIAARHFAILTGYKIVHVIDELTTYGDVKCWLNPFYKFTQAKRLREYVTPNDGVTFCVPFYRRDKKCKVGPKFSIKELFRSEYYHMHYEEYDYSKYE